VKAFDDAQVTVDFNHPLAGKTLNFEVEILEVKAV
jgi:FKBP-type peptidyl-prolyl cis-trans isomerase SlpA